MTNLLHRNDKPVKDEGKGKGKGRFMGLFNTAAVRPIVFIPPTNSHIHLQRRHASYRCARTSEGRNYYQ